MGGFQVADKVDFSKKKKKRKKYFVVLNLFCKMLH